LHSAALWMILRAMRIYRFAGCRREGRRRQLSGQTAEESSVAVQGIPNLKGNVVGPASWRDHQGGIGCHRHLPRRWHFRVPSRSGYDLRRTLQSGCHDDQSEQRCSCRPALVQRLERPRLISDLFINAVVEFVIVAFVVPRRRPQCDRNEQTAARPL